MILMKPISPVAVNLFGLEIRWYAIAYVLAFVMGFWMLKKLDGREPGAAKKYYDDLFSYLILGVIAGGRLGYVLFYNLPFFIENPLEIFMVWHGGMSFHGGLAGVILAVFLFARKQPGGGASAARRSLSILDRLAVVAPIGLFFGRIANFINMELMGRETTGPFGVVFEGFTTVPRHPSPLYEAGLEGVLLFAVMLTLRRTGLKNRAGAISGVFGILYGSFRIFCEQFRMPDVQVGFLFGTDWLTMGMTLSACMIAAGIAMICLSKPDGK